MYRIKEGLIFYTLGEEKSFPKYAGKQRSSKQKKKKKFDKCDSDIKKANSSKYKQLTI